MHKIKWKVATVALVAVMLTFLTQGSLAYYQAIGKATNVVTSGDIQLRIHETTDQGTEFPEDGVYVIPGDIVSKEVTVENDCAHPFYLRVKIVYGINEVELPSEECFKLNINEQDWELHDGWYYYKTVLNPAEFTSEVFSQVEIIGSQVDTGYIGKTLSLTVRAQAVQSENNPLVDGKIYTASGWPQEGNV